MTHDWFSNNLIAICRIEANFLVTLHAKLSAEVKLVISIIMGSTGFDSEIY